MPRKVGRQAETHFITKICEKTNLGPNYLVLKNFHHVWYPIMLKLVVLTFLIVWLYTTNSIIWQCLCISLINVLCMNHTGLFFGMKFVVWWTFAEKKDQKKKLDSTLLANYSRKISYLHVNASNQQSSYELPRLLLANCGSWGFEFKCITISTVVSPKDIFPYSCFIFLSRSCHKEKGLMLRDFVHYKTLEKFGVSNNVFMQLLC